MKLDKTSQPENKRSQRKGTRTSAPLIHTLRDAVNVLNGKLQRKRRGPGAELYGSVLTAPVSGSSWALLGCLKGPCSPGIRCYLSLPHSLCLKSNLISFGYAYKVCATIALAYFGRKLWKDNSVSDVVTHRIKSSTWEAKIGRSWVWDKHDI